MVTVIVIDFHNSSYTIHTLVYINNHLKRIDPRECLGDFCITTGTNLDLNFRFDVRLFRLCSNCKLINYLCIEYGSKYVLRIKGGSSRLR